MPAASEVWDHFHKDFRHYKNNHSHKQSLCKYCVKIVNFLVYQDNAALAVGRISTFRDPTVIEQEVVDTTFSGDLDIPHTFSSSIELRILAGKVDHLWKHLCNCPYAPTAVKDLANANIAAKHQRSATRAVKNIETAIPGGPTLNSSSASQGIEATLAPPLPSRASSRSSSISSVHSVMVLFLGVLLSILFGIIFFAKCVPGSVLPGHDVLSGWILDEEVAKADARTKDEVQNCYATGQADGWKNIAKKSLIAGMMNVEYQPYILNITDISSKPKTAETLLDIILREIEYVTKVLLVLLVAWCTDASGESAKMRCLLREKYAWIVVLDCWAHQFNLVTGDVLKLKLPLINVADRALEVIKWFSSHSIALGLLNEEQCHSGTATPLVLILPVITRWTLHYLSMDCLVTLEVPFHRLILDQATKNRLVLSAGKQREAKDKARRILKIIEGPSFWINIKSLRDLLRPFAIATNAAQADNCHLDTVLLLMGYLYYVHTGHCIDSRIRKKVHASLEKCWKNTDQDIFVLGLTFTKYLGGTGKWSDERMSLRYHRDNAKSRNTYVNIVQIWREHSSNPSNAAGSSMVDMAMRIESMAPNSASTERFFSLLTGTHTKVRNWMAPPSYQQKHTHEDDINRINLAMTPAPASDNVEAEISAGLDELDINDPEPSAEPDEEQSPTAEPRVSTFDEVTRDLRESADKDVEETEEEGLELESIGDPITNILTSFMPILCFTLGTSTSASNTLSQTGAFF
ncbi:hypothetical protein BT96DRAFT_996988 [Gymnopus androsaceus JB14]|uniref:DUF659 domain-containing protein n=1 Tax=Gymnopus androsaceus JB14 TaxID=1447944 RepID=A0A6A4HEP8_9AGAR|nr:hypothetical protein BT96DRAFT_996988 [Gymnopus androsaceus JB14]